MIAEYEGEKALILSSFLVEQQKTNTNKNNACDSYFLTEM